MKFNNVFLRTTVAGIIIAGAYQSSSSKEVVTEISTLSPTVVSKILYPRSVQELSSIVNNTSGKISVAGGRFSQGGQIAVSNGTVIDMKFINKVVSFDTNNKSITVQAGIRWKDIQKYIDPYNLSVKVMQSYHDFSVGGSLSVNVHGRGVHCGSLVETVESIQLMLADGSLVHASRKENADLFRAAIGGYGLIGIITQATLSLTDNVRLERCSYPMQINQVPSFFFDKILSNNKAVFFNGNLYPDKFNQVLGVAWCETDKPVTVQERLQGQGMYLKNMIEEQLLRRIPLMRKLRTKVEPKRMAEPAVVWRNYEMSYSVNELEPLVRFPTTNILQEYFVPVDRLLSFVPKIRSIIADNAINVLNISIRYVPADRQTLLAFAPRDSFALVFYINVPTTKSQKNERAWTQKLIDAALSEGGTFYMPYHLYATKMQFQGAYPQYAEFLKVKQRVDPQAKFSNSLYEKYML